jgi:KaiC/GvpD/RAD55 family RecA-like ATPase
VQESEQIFGIPEVDGTLFSALPPGWLALLSGHSGSGAPLLAKQFAHAGIGRVPVLFYTTFERTGDVRRAFEEFGWDPAEVKIVNLADEYYERVLVHGLEIARAREKGLSLDEMVGGTSRTRSAINERSISATAARIVNTRRPVALVVSSSGWVRDAKPTPACSRSRSVARAWRVERKARSSFHTRTRSTRRWAASESRRA